MTRKRRRTQPQSRPEAGLADITSNGEQQQ